MKSLLWPTEEKLKELNESMYITHKVGMTYPPLEINAFPFPPDNLLPIIETNEFFIEIVAQWWYLRHITYQYLCLTIYPYKKEISVLGLDINDTPTEVRKELINYYVYFDGTPLSVGYTFNGKDVFFLHTDTCPCAPEVLAISQPNLFAAHMGARLTTTIELENSRDRYRSLKFKKYLTENNLQPKGDWEYQQFNNIFGGNPFILSDDEFEMIFGIERP